MNLSLDEITRFLDELLNARYSDENGGVHTPLARPITRLGMALEPWSGMAEWVVTEHLDALFLHRPWQLSVHPAPRGTGIISYHRAFDERLTLGWNIHLARALGLSAPTPFGEKAGRLKGMLGSIAAQNLVNFQQHISELFGGIESVHGTVAHDISRVAVVGMLNDDLVRQAAAAGVDVYLTGQWRPSAARAVSETELCIIVVGHRRSEEWG